MADETNLSSKLPVTDRTREIGGRKLCWWCLGSGFPLCTFLLGFADSFCYVFISSPSYEASPLCLILCNLFPRFCWYVEVCKGGFEGVLVSLLLITMGAFSNFGVCEILVLRNPLLKSERCLWRLSSSHLHLLNCVPVHLNDCRDRWRMLASCCLVSAWRRLISLAPSFLVVVVQAECAGWVCWQQACDLSNSLHQKVGGGGGVYTLKGKNMLPLEADPVFLKVTQFQKS